MKALKEYMNREGISQQELARRLGVSGGLVSLILSGQRSIGKKAARAAAALLGVDVAAVLYPPKERKSK